MKAFCLSTSKNRPLRLCLVALFFISSIGPSAGQCGNTLGIRTYDTLLTGPGYGTYTISFPKWSPDSGVLLSVKLSALVNQQYSFTLKNADLSPSIYTLLVGRYDEISSPVMSSPFSTTTEQTIGSYSLNPGASVSRAPFTLLQNYASTDSITDQVSTFAGSGSLSFVYAPITWSDVHTNNNSSYTFGAAAADSIHFSMSYQYCRTSVLASSLISFAAQPQAHSVVQLSWIMANEEPGRSYEVQQSEDGVHFTSVASLPSVAGGTGNAGYAYTWTMPAIPVAASLPGAQAGGGPGWYFRLKIDDANGGSTYSGIKLVTLDPGTGSGIGLSLYPDPTTDFVNIDFGSAISGSLSAAGRNWQVDLFSADGRFLQRENYSRTHSVRLSFRQPLAPGAYFIRATDRESNKNYTGSFLVR